MLPSKVIPISESVLCKLPLIMVDLQFGKKRVIDLWMDHQEAFREIGEFLYALDILYVVDAILIDEAGEVSLNA